MTETQRAIRLAYMRAWRQANREKVRACSRAWYWKNREKVRACSRAWKQANREKVRACSRAWKQANPEKVRAWSRAWYQANRERKQATDRAWYQANREKVQAWSRAWKQANPEKVRARNHRRRTQIAGGGGSYTSEDFKQLCRLAGHRCLCCGKKRKLEADHVIPVIKGGSSNIENIQPLCRTCNSAKGGKEIDYRPTVRRAALVRRILEEASETGRFKNETRLQKD